MPTTRKRRKRKTKKATIRFPLAKFQLGQKTLEQIRPRLARFRDNGRMLYTIGQAARMVGVSRARIDKFIHQGRLPFEIDPIFGARLVSLVDLKNVPVGARWKKKEGDNIAGSSSQSVLLSAENERGV